MNDLNPYQLESLEKMRVGFSSHDGTGMSLNDNTLLRYLKARSFSFEKASKMLEATLNWRRSFNLANFQLDWRETIAVENSTGKSYIRGYDREGHAIVVMKPRFENTFNHEGNIKHLIYTMERAVACSEKRGQDKITLLIDFEGYSIFNAPPMQTSRETLSILQDHYPERLHRAYLLHPPFIFYGFFKMISPFIDPITKDKINMVTNAEMADRANAKLFQDISPDMLEVSHGGTDDRPFSSELYLSGDFSNDFATILNIKESISRSNEGVGSK